MKLAGEAQSGPQQQDGVQPAAAFNHVCERTCVLSPYVKAKSQMFYTQRDNLTFWEKLSCRELDEKINTITSNAT